MRMDAFEPDPQVLRVVLRLFDRLAPSTDDPDLWAQLPAEFTVYRAGPTVGFSWTTEQATAHRLADAYDLVPMRMGTVTKSDVLAHITFR